MNSFVITIEMLTMELNRDVFESSFAGDSKKYRLILLKSKWKLIDQIHSLLRDFGSLWILGKANETHRSLLHWVWRVSAECMGFCSNFPMKSSVWKFLHCLAERVDYLNSPRARQQQQQRRVTADHEWMCLKLINIKVVCFSYLYTFFLPFIIKTNRQQERQIFSIIICSSIIHYSRSGRISVEIRSRNELSWKFVIPSS